MIAVKRAADVSAEGKPSVAVGLGGVFDWETPRFIDRAKQARGWLGTDYSTDHSDVSGNLIDNGSGGTQRLFTFHSDGNYGGHDTSYRGGTFRVTWTGSGTIALGGSGGSNLSGSASGATFDLNGNGGTTWFVFSGIDFANPPRNVSIIRTDQIALHAAGAIFDPDMLAEIDGFGCFRFMDWQRTNGSLQVSWSDRPLMSWQRWVTLLYGTPLEAMIALCNETGRDGWFCIPHQADDAYIAAFVQMVHDTLDPSLVAWFEYSNECWNTAGPFTQSAYCAAQGLALLGAVGTEHDRRLTFQGKRSTDMMRIVRSIYGTSRRARGVIGLQTLSSPSTTPLVASLWQTADPANYQPPHEMHDAIACTGYFGNSLAAAGPAPAGYDDEIWAELSTNGQSAAVTYMLGLATTALTGTTIPAMRACGALARQYGKQLLMYEGNQHIELGVAGAALLENGQPKAGVVDLFGAVNYSAGMAALQEQMRDAFRDAGGILYNGFVDITRHSKFGSWGHKRYRTDSNPIWDGLVAWQTANPRWWIR
jgi:hypothetical protein